MLYKRATIFLLSYFHYKFCIFLKYFNIFLKIGKDGTLKEQILAYGKTALSSSPICFEGLRRRINNPSSPVDV